MIEDEPFGLCVSVDHQRKLLVLSIGDHIAVDLTAKGGRELAAYLLEEAQALDQLIAESGP